jgi:5'-3' exonuclease
VVGFYIEGLHWVMDYYYRGVPSWTWFFPFHYAPFLSDLTDLDAIVADIEQADPVAPFQQAPSLSLSLSLSLFGYCLVSLGAATGCR